MNVDRLKIDLDAAGHKHSARRRVLLSVCAVALALGLVACVHVALVLAVPVADSVEAIAEGDGKAIGYAIIAAVLAGAAIPVFASAASQALLGRNGCHECAARLRAKGDSGGP